MKSNTHQTIHLLAQEKDGSSIKAMKQYRLVEVDDVLKSRGTLEFAGKTVTAVRPHPNNDDSWQVETGEGLIWVEEKNLESLKGASHE
ncbi:hypothetical protein F937_01778 [Acinetobacter calcoaceticus ANC 3680]|uniref:hypothetical protein n=1 Tax=Acinetobacter calcoaceticus TaxID=471 RepID=UPI0002CE5FC8|nr:hypothetical protein [Acinetobacter calcoaceticus]ENV92384.1 hypothetical protein F937_01778 [Acinetobacter calcoaceticus ANC 3680]